MKKLIAIAGAMTAAGILTKTIMDNRKKQKEKESMVDNVFIQTPLILFIHGNSHIGKSKISFEVIQDLISNGNFSVDVFGEELMNLRDTCSISEYYHQTDILFIRDTEDKKHTHASKYAGISNVCSRDSLCQIMIIEYTGDTTDLESFLHSQDLDDEEIDIMKSWSSINVCVRESALSDLIEYDINGNLGNTGYAALMHSQDEVISELCEKIHRYYFGEFNW